VTISISSNDFKFADILSACVLRLAARLSPDCNAAISNANDIIQNGGLKNDVTSALQQIISKSGRPDFALYVTGYTAFFNVDTDWCDTTTFCFWDVTGGHGGAFDPAIRPALSKDLRLRLNNLVIDVNRMLAGIVDEVSAGVHQTVRFIDPNPRFNSHRFCEQDGGQDVHEQDKIRQDTWVFLSGWPDNTFDNAVAADSSSELSELFTSNTTAIPDVATACANVDNGSDNDPYDFLLCQIAQVNADPTLPEYQILVDDQAVVPHSNVRIDSGPPFSNTLFAQHPFRRSDLATVARA
jgi:hypothetical protein